MRPRAWGIVDTSTGKTVEVLISELKPDRDPALIVREIDLDRAKRVLEGWLPLHYGAYTRPFEQGHSTKYAAKLFQGEPDVLMRFAKAVPKNGIIVEIGSAFGGSAKIFAEHADSSVSIYCIDCDWQDDINRSDTDMQEFIAGNHWFFHKIVTLDQLKQDYNIEHAATSYDFARQYLSPHANVTLIPACSPHDCLAWSLPVDLIFTDGPTSVVAHHRHWWPYLKTNGVYLGHDYHESQPTVVEVVEELAAEVGAVFHVEKTFWYMIKQ